MAISWMAACGTPSPGTDSAAASSRCCWRPPSRRGRVPASSRAAAARARHCSAWPPACPASAGLGIEQDPALVALAQRNAAANGWPDLRFMAADIASLPALDAIRPRLRQSALSRRRRHAIAGRFPPRRQARGRRAAGRLGHRAGTPVAAARHAQLHPAGRIAGRGDDGIRRCRAAHPPACCRYGPKPGSRRNCCCCAA